MSMEWTVEQLMTEPKVPERNKTITQSEYLQWARGFVFEGLRDQRYGQSFCNYFGIRDNILFYSSTVEDADRYIQENYIK